MQIKWKPEFEVLVPFLTKYVVSRVQDDVTNGGTTHLYVKRLKGDEIQWKVEVGTIINGKTPDLSTSKN